MQFATRIGLLAAAFLALVPYTHAATVSVTQISCSYLYFTLGLTAAEAQNAQYLGVYQGTTMISEIQFNAAYANTNSYQWYAPFFPGVTLQSGPQQIAFRLLDTNERPITAYNAITQTINFQCGTTVTSSSANPSSPTNGSGNNGSNGNNGSSDSSNSGSSSGSSSSTGAIAGGVAGGVAALIIVGLIAFCLMRKKKKQQRAQQSRLRSDEADEAAFRAPNNDSTTSLATAPETANTPMMRDVSTKNVFADPTTSAVSGAPSGTSTLVTANNQPASKSSSSTGAGAGVAAAAAGGIGAAAIAARKQSREQSRAHSPLSESSPTSESFKDTPMSQAPPPVPALPASAPAPYPKPASTQSNAAQPAPQTQPPASSPATTTTTAANDSNSSAVPVAAGAGAAGVTAAAAATAAKDNKTKGGKWGFKRASKDMANTSKPPYPQAVPEPIAVPAAASSSTPSPPTNNSPEMPASPSRSFKVIQKSAAGPSSASIAPSENSLNRAPIFPPPHSGHATPAGSIRGNNYSRAPSVASMSAGFTDAAPPPLPSGAASVSSAPVGEFGGNMAGIGAGSRSFGASSGNSTKWHQQSYNIMPNFSHRALARSTQLDEDLIFGHLGMGLSPPAPPQQAGNGSETGSSKSRTDPFGDR
ncbi:uncharacterized protein UTRI_04403 [Ustilago trichophora]|uniref:Uncharacterized protein n=1 Tax=Ustilago trichophora TaxID=86804 RepID=A0A5C3ETD5_9BASI|nr:uncharacterized protein UTRI_04403 [Ustilago trichophora]